VTCPSGWVLNGESCYWFLPYFNVGIWDTWDRCNAHCTGSYPGATMLCVNNVAENEWIISKSEGHNTWIGYTDMLPYGGGKGTKQYGWVTGCSSTYTNWESGEPNNSGKDEDYAYVVYYRGLWRDGGPRDQSFCGCEYNPALTTTPSSRPTTASSSHPSTVSSSRPTVAPSSGPTSSPTATPSFTSSQEDVSE